MTEFENPESDFITMFDEDGNEVVFKILITKQAEECLYMLVESPLDDDVSEVIIFRCVEEPSEEKDDDMVFELVEEGHKAFKEAMELFKEDFDALGIEY